MIAWVPLVVVLLAELGGIAKVAAARADDRPVVIVTPQGPAPARLDVHVGEIVSWRGPGNERLRIELDDHPSAHEIIERQGEVRGIFRRAGEHTYTARLVGRETVNPAGVINVRAALRPEVGPPVCAPESSYRICFEP